MDIAKRSIASVLLVLMGAIVAYGVTNVRLLHELGDPRHKQFKSPGDAAIAPDGAYYVLDSGNCRVVYFGPGGKKRGEFGGNGRGEGRFSDPRGIAVHDGKVFVTDAKLDLVQVFDKQGKFLYEFGGRGNAPGRLHMPWGIVVSNQERVYIAEKAAGRIKIFTTQGVYLGTMGEDLSSPTYLAIDRSEKLYVSDTRARAYVVLDRHGKLVKKIYSKESGISDPGGVAVNDRGMIIATDPDGGRIVWLDPKGKPAGSFGSPGSGRGQFKKLCGIQTGPRSTVVVADCGNNRVAVLALEPPAFYVRLRPPPVMQRVMLQNDLAVEAVDVAVGDKGELYTLSTKQARIGVYVDKKGKIASYMGLPEKEAGRTKGNRIVFADGKIYVSDRGMNRILVYDKQGNLKFSFGQRGSDKGRFDNPGGMAVSDKIYIADTGNNRVQVFSLDGVFLSEINDPNLQLSRPVDVAITPDGHLLVADSGNNRIVRFELDGKLAGVAAGPDGKLLGGMMALRVDKDGRIYVLTSRNNEAVRLLDSDGKLLMRFSSLGSLPGELNHPTGMDVQSGSIYIADTGNKRVVNFALMDVPAEPQGLRIVQTENSSILQWKANTETYLEGYRIYAINESGKKRGLGDAAEPKYSIPVPLEGGETKFAITAYSKSGLESNLSEVVTDWGRMGIMAMERDDPIKAAEYFHKALNANPDNHYCALQLGRVLVGLGRLDEAAGQFEKLAKVKEWAIPARQGLGKVAFKKGDLQEAEAQLKRALALDAQNPETRIYLAEVLIARRKWQEALEHAREAANLAPQNAHAHEIVALTYLHQRLYGKAETAMLSAISIKPSDPKLHLELAEIYIARDDKKSARAQLEKALEVNPDFIEARIALGTLLLQMGLVKEASTQAQKAIQLNPNQAGGYLLKGKILFTKGDREGAVESFHKAISINPDNPDAYANLAEAYLGLGEASEADRILQDARLRFPKNRKICLVTAKVREAQNDLSGALDALSRAIEVDPNCLEARLQKGRLHMKRKEYQAAAAEFGQAARLSTDDVKIRIEWAKALELAGKKSKAEEVLVDAVNIDPNNAEAHFALGSLWADAQDYERALSELKLAAYTAPDNPLYHHALGKAYVEAGELDGAVDELRRALELDPKNEVIRRDLDLATAARAKYRRSANLPPVEITEVRINPAFAAIHKTYDTVPIGKITLRNNSRRPVLKVKVSFKVNRFQPVPTVVVVDKINPRRRKEIPLKAAFSSRVLDIKTDTPALGIVKVEYYRRGSRQRLSTTAPFTIYSRNAIKWSNWSMVGAFVTPTDWPVGEFARRTMEAVGDAPEGMPEPLHKATALFEALGEYHVGYLEDPNRPFNVAEGQVERIDTVQFPRDTLRLRHGDCDDLSVLYSALLENIGVHTAIALVPGHVLLLVNSGLSEEDVYLLTEDEGQVVVRDGTVWVPVETTVVGAGFSEAWVKGAELCANAAKKGKLKIVPLSEAWRVYPPAALRMTHWLPRTPPADVLAKRVKVQEEILRSKQLERQVTELEKAVKSNPNDPSPRLRLGILYARNNELEKAMEQFEHALKIDPQNADAMNNIGNVHYLEGNYQAALENYLEAEKVKPDDAEIKINLALAYYRLGNMEKAREKFEQAAQIDHYIAGENEELKKLIY